MNESNGHFDELGRLAAALCDGEITPEQAVRLELLVSQSEAAQQYFLDYAHIHGALCARFQQPAGDDACDLPGQEELAAPQPRPRGAGSRRRPLVYSVVAASLLLALTLGVFQWNRLRDRDRASAVACVRDSMDAAWAEGAGPDDLGRLAAGRRVVLRAGFAAIEFDNGARILLQGPATFAPQSAGSAWLGEGQLTARVPPAAAGFAVRTPTALIVDRGTEFGVAVEADGQSEVEVFDGRVELVPGAVEDDGAAPQALHRGEALRVLPAAAGELPQIERLAAGTRQFVRGLPGSLARFRDLVTTEPDLLHYYTFEGATVETRCSDKRGGLHLRDVGMRSGRDGGQLEFPPAWLEPDGRACRPFRGALAGNERGVGLQSRAEFRPPPAMTVELLVRIADVGEDREGAVCAAVATRASRRDCGFLITVQDHGNLACLLDAEGPWLKSEFEFVPGRWYYVAGTFQTTATGETIVNAYASDLSAGEPTLRRLLRDRRAPGAPAIGPLGIGKGFDGELADAYPWSGDVDEIAIYGAVLEERVLQAHLEALIRG